MLTTLSPSPHCHASTSDGALLVLTNKELFREIVPWSPGWPALVAARWREIKEEHEAMVLSKSDDVDEEFEATVLSKSDFMWALIWQYDLRTLELTRQIYPRHFVVDSVAPAIEAADADAVRLALEFSRPAHTLLRRRYWRLAIEKFPGHVDVLEELDMFEPLDKTDLCLEILKSDVSDDSPSSTISSDDVVPTDWARVLASIDSVVLIEWLLSKFGVTSLPPTLIHNAALRGNLELVQRLDSVANQEIQPHTLDEVYRLAQEQQAANASYMKVFRFLLEQHVEHHSQELDVACLDAGDTETLELISRARSGLRFLADVNIDTAASRRQLEVIQLVAKSVRVTCTTEPMDGAAANGHLDVVEYLHTTHAVGCTPAAMDNAASNGHLDVVMFLHKNRTEGCTPLAMNIAAGRGFLEVVQFLHENRHEGSATEAMEHEARMCYRRVVTLVDDPQDHVVDPAIKETEELRVAKVRHTLLYLLERSTEAHPESLEHDALRCSDQEVLRVIHRTRGFQFIKAVGIGAPTRQGDSLRLTSVSCKRRVNAIY